MLHIVHVCILIEPMQNGQTALEIAEEIGNKAMVEEIKKHSSVADSKVRFCTMYNVYVHTSCHITLSLGPIILPY